jgi:hypothetical protein
MTLSVVMPKWVSTVPAMSEATTILRTVRDSDWSILAGSCHPHRLLAGHMPIRASAARGRRLGN